MSKTKNAIISIAATLMVALSGNLSAQSTKEIPVYPGANLVTETDAGADPHCCSFSTRDSFDKVLSFYQSVLQTKPMDTKQLAAAYPAMKELFQGLERQMPSTMKYRAFVLSEMEMNGKKGAILFEIISNPTGVNFTIPELSVAQKDVHFVSQWREQTGQSMTEEKAGKSVADWKQLQGALPSAAAIGDLRRGEVNGATDREGPSPSSSVWVSYQKKVPPGSGGEESGSPRGIAVTITIEDAGSNQEFATEMTSPAGPEEKAATVRGKYKGKERSTKNDMGYESCEMVFLVNKRFIVECKGEGTRDLTLINKLIDGMNLERLAGLK